MTDRAKDWDGAAHGYGRYYVPRFGPWTPAAAALGLLARRSGAVLRQFPELPALAHGGVGVGGAFLATATMPAEVDADDLPVRRSLGPRRHRRAPVTVPASS